MSHVALSERMKKYKKKRVDFCGFNQALESSPQTSVSQTNQIYKKLPGKLDLINIKIKSISGHSIRVGMVQDLLNLAASISIIMQ
jgi:hypothetical protein